MGRCGRIGILASLALAAGGAVAVMRYGVVFKQQCAEGYVYRTKFGLYLCEYNAEADPDWQCHEKLAGLGGYFMLRELTPQECAAGRWVP